MLLFLLLFLLSFFFFFLLSFPPPPVFSLIGTHLPPLEPTGPTLQTHGPLNLLSRDLPHTNSDTSRGPRQAKGDKGVAFGVRYIQQRQHAPQSYPPR